MATTTAAALQDPLGAFRQMSMNQRFTWLAGLAVLIALVVVTLMWTSRLDYQVLYTNLSERDGGAVIGELQKLNVPYRITGGGAVIEVPSAQVYATRMKLAASGLPKGAGVGFEVLDKEPMGTSQFVERINYQRALEGSLGRTIESLSAVDSATVHLAIPKPSVFLSESEKPSGSVLLKLYPGRVLSGAQVAGIVHLVASAVAGLGDQDVSVVDQDGNLLTAGPRADSGIQPEQLAYRSTVEQQYRKQIEALLAPLVGRDGVRVAVSADIDFAKTESSSVVYGQGHLLSQQQQSTSSNGSASLPAGVPGALTNQPPGGVTAPFAVGSASAPLTPEQFAQITPSLKTLAPTAASSSATNNYDLDKTVSHTQLPVGSVKRLSVSVLVNDQAKGGKPIPLSAAQLGQMKQLVENAIGFDTKRGDTVSVVNMPFTAAQTEAEKALPVWRQPWIWDGVRQAVPYVIALILGLMAYRAMRKAATGGGRRPKGGAAEPALASADGAPLGGEPGSSGLGAGIERAAAGMPGTLAPDTVHLSNTLETDAAISRELVKQDPRRAAQVVKEWLSDGQ
ncbi:flagellar basal-body MS-ring/collar protein FliF [Thiomonas intermedia]|uniref:flagellar basal-body MS-ring/collar protein FliF n=1 Tax=Thiomonas intermedia TaxID=926 RepID=UPI0009A47E2A|nr:flagellar basal-body MS-ring/collar protein FliF [Thiomonas intermedia]